MSSEKKISDLDTVPSLDNTALFEIEQGGVSFKVARLEIVAAAGIQTINADNTAAQLLTGQANKILIADDLAGNHTFTIGTDIITLNDIQTLTNKTITAAANTLVIASTDLSDSANLARNTDNLSFFAATTSLQLLGVISDETGTGLLVFNNTPTIITPTIASFANATHSHLNAAGGGTITKASISDTPWAKADLPATTVYNDQANVFGDFDQTFKDNRIVIESPDGLTPTTIANLQQTLARTLSIPILTADRNFVVTGESSQITLGTEVTGASTDLSDSANLARNTDNLGFFAATTSLQLLGIMSDETGTGLLVFNDTPTIITPTIASFANAAHSHLNAAGGGTITKAAISDFAHQATHQSGGGDALTGLLDATARTSVSKNSAADVGARRTLNFIEGSNITLTIVDDVAGEEVDITIASTGGGGSEFADDVFRITGSVDATKKLAFEVDDITTATTRTITMLNEDLTIVGLTNAQTLTNKIIALGSNTISGTAAQFNTAVTDDTFAYISDNLSVFAATTSAQLASIISDETGTGLLVFGTNATLVTPTIASFANATHDHSNAAGGGNLTNSALTSGVFSNITGLGAQSQVLDMNTQILQFVDANQTIQNNAGNLFYDVATGQVHLWRINNVTKMQLSATALDLQSNALLTTGAVRITGGTMRIPLSATPTMAVDGDFAIDTTVTDFSHGVLKFFDGEEIGIVSMPIAQFTSPTDGNVVSYNATNDEFELAAAGGGLTFAKVVKPSDETVTSSTVLQDDDNLFSALSVSKTYGFLLFIFINSGTTPDFKYNFTLPTGATGLRINGTWSPSAAVEAKSVTEEKSVLTNASDQSLQIVGKIIMSTTSGNLQFQWAQNNSDAGATKVLQGSYLVVWEE